jgi:hypothetical protein
MKPRLGTEHYGSEWLKADPRHTPKPPPYSPGASPLRGYEFMVLASFHAEWPLLNLSVARFELRQ